MIIIPKGKYLYKRLPMGVVSSPDILQQKMNDLFRGFEFIGEYMDDLLVFKKKRIDILRTEIIMNSK